MIEHIKKSIEEYELQIKRIRTKIFFKCNVTIELGKAEVNGKEISVILGETHLEEFAITEISERLNCGAITGFGMDVQASVEGNPIVCLFDGDNHVGHGAPFVIRDESKDIEGELPVGTLGVKITSDMAGYPDHILKWRKGETLTLDNCVRRLTPEDEPNLSEHLLSKRRRLVCNLYLDGKPYAKGWIPNIDSICDPDLPMTERFAIVITELV